MKILLILLTLSGAQGEWYRSNSIGQALAPVPWYRAGEYEYSLKREKTGLSEVLLHYRGKTLVERQERDLFETGRLKRVLILRQGTPRQEEHFDAQGKLIRSLEYKDGKLLEEREYQYRENYLQKVLIRDPQGNPLGTEDYQRTPDNRLRRLVISSPDGQSSVFHWLSGSEGLQGEWVSQGGQESLRLYRPGGALALRKDWVPEGPVLTETFTFEGEALKTSELNLTKGEREQSYFDPQGRRLKQEFYADQVWKATVEWTWSGDDILTETRLSPGRKEEIFYRRDPKGSLISQENFLDGILGAKIFYREGVKVREEVYSGGFLVLGADFDDGIRVRETYYDGAKVLRTRDLRSQ